MIGKRLRKIRRENNYKQKDVAKLLNISYKTYSNYETESDTIPIDKLYKFCNIFNVRIDYICSLTNIKYLDIKIDKELDFKILGNLLKSTRTLNNDKQSDVSLFLDISRSNYSKYESGGVTPTLITLIKFAKHYKVSLDYLCNRIK